MRTVILSCVFPPEPVVTGQTSQQMAEGLRSKGGEVTVIAPFPSRPAGRPYEGYTRRLYQGERMEIGVKILRCFSIFSRRSTLLSRFAENISFGLFSALALLMVRRPDVVYINTWPLFAMGMAVTAASLRRIPIVLSIQDIYPETLVSQGRLGEGGMAARVLERLDRLVVSRATTVVVISESFRKIYLRRGVPDRRLHLVPNWVDRKSIKPDADGRRIRQKLSIPEKAFLTVYGGNIAAAAGVEAAIEAFSKLEDKAEMYFCIAGEGANLEGCRQLAQRLGCERVRFHAPWEVEETSEMLAAADLLLLPTRAEQSIASVPSKLIAYMLAARPVLALAVKGSDVAMTIEKAEAGWVIAPGDEKALLSRWCEIAQMDRASLAWHGKAAREYALLNMTSDICLPRLLDLVEQAGSS